MWLYLFHEIFLLKASYNHDIYWQDYHQVVLLYYQYYQLRYFLYHLMKPFFLVIKTADKAAPREAPPEGSILIGHFQIFAIIFNISLSFVGPPVTAKSVLFEEVNCSEYKATSPKELNTIPL